MIELERLVSLVLRELGTDEAESVGEHLLSCDSCAETVELLLEVEGGVREAVANGRLRFALTSAMVAELDRRGLIARTYRLAPGGSVACGVGADDVYQAVWLEADLVGVERVDAIKKFMPGMIVRVEDVPFDREHGLVRIVELGAFLRTLPTFVGAITLVAVANGSERTLGEYFLHHTGFGSRA
jgi:hypothetical protein